MQSCSLRRPRLSGADERARPEAIDRVNTADLRERTVQLIRKMRVSLIYSAYSSLTVSLGIKTHRMSEMRQPELWNQTEFSFRH